MSKKTLRLHALTRYLTLVSLPRLLINILVWILRGLHKLKHHVFHTRKRTKLCYERAYWRGYKSANRHILALIYTVLANNSSLAILCVASVMCIRTKLTVFNMRPKLPVGRWFFSRTLQLHCKVRLLSWYVVCRLSVTSITCDKTTEVRITRFHINLVCLNF